MPSIVVAGEQHNILARLAAGGHPVSLRVELRTRYVEDDRNSYNVIAEIPGRDPALRDEIVLIGAHLDSWHTASGATDNADGAVAVMEAMRILQRARRTAAAHDSGGAVERRGARVCSARRAYVAQHFNTPGGTRSARGVSERRPWKRQDARLLHGRESRGEGDLRSLARAAEGPGRDAEHHRGHRRHRPRAVQRGRATRLQRDQGLRTRTTSARATPTPTTRSA